MDVYHTAQLLDGSAHAHQHTGLLHNVGTMGTIGMTAKNPTGIGLAEEFQYTFGLAYRQGFTIGAPESLATFIGNAFFLQLVFALTYARCFRSSEDGGRDRAHPRPLRGWEVIYYYSGLRLCCMGQHLTAIHIADGVYRGER